MKFPGRKDIAFVLLRTRVYACCTKKFLSYIVIIEKKHRKMLADWIKGYSITNDVSSWLSIMIFNNSWCLVLTAFGCLPPVSNIGGGRIGNGGGVLSMLSATAVDPALVSFELIVRVLCSSDESKYCPPIATEMLHCPLTADLTVVSIQFYR